MSKLIFIFAVGITLSLSAYSNAECPKGFQTWPAPHPVCLPDRMVAYLTCLKTTGGGLITVEKDESSATSTRFNIGGEGAVMKGKGKVSIDTRKSGIALNKIKQKFDPHNNTKCFEAAFTQADLLSPHSDQSSKAPKKTVTKPKKSSKKQKVETYKLRPTLPINQPISVLNEVNWAFSSKDKTSQCTCKVYREYVYTVLGRNADGEPSAVKRKFVSDKSTTSCKALGKEEAKVTETHGELEGLEFLAHQTTEGLWVLDDLPGTTEKQKKTLMDEGFMEPFSGIPYEKVPVGKLITFKDEEVSLAYGAVFPGKKEGSMCLKFVRVTKDREPVAQLSYSMSLLITKLDDSNNEVRLKMIFNGGASISLSEKSRISSLSSATGFMSLTTSDMVVSGPATIKIIIKEI